MRPERLPIEQEAMRLRKKAKDALQAKVRAKKRRESKLRWWRKTMSSAACKSAKRKADREAVEQRKRLRLAKRAEKLARKKQWHAVRDAAKRRKLKGPAEVARIFQEGYAAGVRFITEGGQWIKKP